MGFDMAFLPLYVAFEGFAQTFGQRWSRGHGHRHVQGEAGGREVGARNLRESAERLVCT